MTLSPQVLYADCFSGISGDMFLGAMLSAGLPPESLDEGLDLLGLKGYKLTINKKIVSAIQAVDLAVRVSGPAPHRSWKNIKKILQDSGLSEAVKKRALTIFQNLARAEAAIHGGNIEEVHFHEVGGLDSIIDITGAAIGLEYFHIDRLVSSPLPMPSGWVQYRHGTMPLPAPAVCEILKNTAVYGVNIQQELVTPTGAAIIKASAADFGPQPAMAMTHIGYGAGCQELSNRQPNLLRLIIGRSRTLSESQSVVIIETNLDDWSPEEFPYLSVRLFSSGALDVVLIPVQMKKGRPGFTIQIISSKAAAPALKDILLSETSAIGLRFRTEERLTLPRQLGSIASAFGPIRVKKIISPAGIRLTPEYEDCKKLAEKNQVPLREIYLEAARQPVHNFKPDKKK